MLAALENIPRSPQQWSLWAWDHRDSHDRIRAAILRRTGSNLADWQIEPINPNYMTDFLQANSSLHDDMNSALNLQSTNIQDANLGDEKELAAWIKLHYLEHYYAEIVSGA